MKIRDIDEFDLIALLTKNVVMSTNTIIGIGDDAGVFSVTKGMRIVTTIDAQVEDVHFSRQYMSPEQVGQRTVGAALSDIAAMGALPRFLLVSLFLPKGLDVSFAKKLYSGIRKTASEYKTTIIGGNITMAEKIIVAICAIGEIVPGNEITRATAQPGDLVCVTGTLGNAHSALLKKQYYKIYPRIQEGRLLAKTKKVTAMIDISDGLSSDLLHICRQSNVGVALFLEKLPRHKNTPYDVALHGGEDYELCFTVAAKNIEPITRLVKKQTGTNVTIVGNILPKAKGTWLVLENGKRESLKAQGWQHFGKLA